MLGALVMRQGMGRGCSVWVWGGGGFEAGGLEREGFCLPFVYGEAVGMAGEGRLEEIEFAIIR